MKRILLVLSLMLLPSMAMAQCNGVFGANQVCGSTGGGLAAPVNSNLLPGFVGGTNGQIQYNSSGALAGFTAIGDCTITPSTGQVICTKTNGVVFAPSATTDTTNAANITSGNLAINRLNGGLSATASTVWTGNGSWNAPQGFPYTPLTGSLTSLTISTKLQMGDVSCEEYTGGCTAANIAQGMTDAAAISRCFRFNGTYVVTTTVSLVNIASNLCLTGRGGIRGPATGTQTAVLEIKNFTGVTVDGNITLDCNNNAFIGAGLKVWSSLQSVQFQSFRFSEYVNCRQAIAVGDPSQSTAPISEINFIGGFFYNVAQGIRTWSNNAVVNFTSFINNVDPHTSPNWALSATGTCTSSQITLSAASANSYFDQYDVISGTGVVAGTYITGQVSGTLGSNGVYNLSTTGNTCSAAAITGEKRGINIWTSGGTVSVVGGEVVNTVVNNGIICLTDVMAGPNSYGSCQVTGSVIEAGGQIAATFNPTNIASPTSGGIQFVGNRGFIGGLTTTNAVVTDTTFPGNITFLGNRIFSTTARTGYNLVGGSTATNIYFDITSFGANMLQGYAGVNGGTQYIIGADGQASATIVSGNATQSPGDTMVVFNCSVPCTYTMLNPIAYPGRELMFTNAAAIAVTSASTNILSTAGAASTSILPGVAGKFIRLRADVGAAAWRATASN